MEKYGVKPQRFTKAWFEYVWDYYKIHIIDLVFLGLLGLFEGSLSFY